MDGSSFDRLARKLGGVANRRDGLKAALGLIGVAVTPAVADASRKATRRHEKLACRNAHSECTSNDQCCSNRCVPKFGGTGFRCAKAHGHKNKGNDKDTGKVIPLGQPCDAKVDSCQDQYASCTTYAYGGAPGGTYCLLPDNLLQANAWTCDLNDECRSGRCADVDGTGKCAPITCNVCKSHENNAACPFEYIQDYMNSIDQTGGDVQVFEGTYLQGLYPRAEVDWHIFPCCTDCYPVIGPDDGDSYALAVDVNDPNNRFVVVERMNISTEAYRPTEHLIQIWGYTDGPIGYMHLTLDTCKVTLAESDRNSGGNYCNYINAESASRVIIRDSQLKGLSLGSNMGASEATNAFTLENSVWEGWGGTGLSWSGVVAYDTEISMIGGTVKNWYSQYTGAGMYIAGRNNASYLTMDGTSQVTSNLSVESSNQGSGIQWAQPMGMQGVSAANVLNNGTSPYTNVEQCAKTDNTACF